MTREMMPGSLVNLREKRQQSTEDISVLQGYLAQLIGEPFRLARVSYGDELTLHFGDLRPGHSPKIKNLFYGDYILGVRASPWLIKSKPVGLQVFAGLPRIPPEAVQHVSNEELEQGHFIKPESRVVATDVFEANPVDRSIGLQVNTSDGSVFYIIPSTKKSDDVRDEDLPEDENLPDLADWELISPRGLLSVGPGRTWSFEPRANPQGE
jgi:hypothetical protein